MHIHQRITLSAATTFLALIAASSLTGCASLSTKPPRGANLSGDWKLDPALTEDPQAQLRANRQTGHSGGSHRWGGGMPGGGMVGGGMPGGGMSGGGGMHGGGHHGGGGSYGGGGSNGGGGRQGGSSASRDFFDQPAVVSIKQNPKELDLVADGVSTQFEYGEKVISSVHNGTAERRAGWKSNDFVVEYKVSEGPSATRSYEVLDGGRQLVVTTEVEGGRGPKISYKTVYERATAS